MTLIAASILAADFARLGDEVRAVEDAGVDWIHVDVMDGHFVPNLTIGPPVVEAIRKVTRLPLDVHLMIEKPERYARDFANAGADYLSVHQEACPHLHAVLHEIRALNVKPAVVINPATPFSSLELVLSEVEMVLVMSVNPGFGGQKFIDSTLGKLDAAQRAKTDRGLGYLVEVDGGVKVENTATVTRAGAEVLVVGTGIFATSDYRRTVTAIRAAAAR